MNFGEKLTSLRKQKGLSQEELGYKLNVTRQTVSKWELGQTTPEMDKLVEMSKIFGVTLDELTNETESNNEVERIEDKHINDRPQNNSTLKIILLIVAIFVIGGIIVYTVIFSKFFSFGKGLFNKAEEGVNAAKSIIDRAIDEANNTNKTLEAEKIFEGNNNEAKEQQENFKKDAFNNGFELYGGTESGSLVKVLIDKIITNNKTQEDKIITVIWEGENITDTEKLKNIKRNFDDFTDYEVSFEYDENGYIYQAEIEEF